MATCDAAGVCFAGGAAGADGGPLELLVILGSYGLVGLLFVWLTRGAS